MRTLKYLQAPLLHLEAVFSRSPLTAHFIVETVATFHVIPRVTLCLEFPAPSLLLL